MEPPGLILRRARINAGLSIRGLANLAGVSASTVSRIEAGQMDPTVGMLGRLLESTGTCMDVSISVMPRGALVNASRPSPPARSRLAFIMENRQAIRKVASQHHARTVSVFGSVARGEDGADSDIDFLVDFDESASLLDLIDIQDALTELLACKVDVVSLGGLKERDENIRQEALPV